MWVRQGEEADRAQPTAQAWGGRTVWLTALYPLGRGFTSCVLCNATSTGHV